jgi:hypothetical protein|tara:strand:- start:55 stop:177 length:123 start_codon:yes stop_codon:yes gene_type:complete
MNLLENKANQIKAKMEGNMATKSELNWLSKYEKKKSKKKK